MQNPTDFNSFVFYLRDATGRAYLWQAVRNGPRMEAKIRKEARWWLLYISGQAQVGRYSGGPVGKVEVVVEYYNDPSFR